jgi:hypothetical protein
MDLPLEVGAVCVTVNARHPINNRLTVLILRIDTARESSNGEKAPFLIQRVDGSAFPSTTDIDTCEPRFYSAKRVWCAAHKLRRIDMGDGRSTLATREPHHASA